jgi:DNA-binding response OmpR family regulator
MPLKILHIENNLDLREDWQEVFSEHFSGSDITGKSSAEAAIRSIEDGNIYSVVIVDIGLNGQMDGLDFIRWLRAVISEVRTTPVIVLSIFDYQEDQLRINEEDPNIPIIYKGLNPPETPNFVLRTITRLTADSVFVERQKGAFIIRLQLGWIILNGFNLGLTPTEYKILKKLLEAQSSTPVSKENLAVCAGCAIGSIPVHITSINGRIHEIDTTITIINIMGVGYYI